eukprot:1158975-Pelagomonas_calceolata.AAC.5
MPPKRSSEVSRNSSKGDARLAGRPARTQSPRSTGCRRDGCVLFSRRSGLQGHGHGQQKGWAL